MQAKVKAAYLVAFMLAVTLFSFSAFAQPTGPDSIERGPSERRAEGAGIAVDAQAGNVTPLNIIATTTTKRWQGYYGNVSGTIVLDDASSNTLYQWDASNPEGEIYAVNGSSTPIWSNVSCFNFTKAEAEQRVTLSEFENAMGIDSGDADGINETFNLTFTGSFQVGSVTIDQNAGCQSVSLNVNDQYDTNSFNETILTDNTTEENIIFVSLLEQDAAGFKSGGEQSDFQMIVAENGDTTEASTYYFYVELS